MNSWRQSSLYMIIYVVVVSFKKSIEFSIENSIENVCFFNRIFKFKRKIVLKNVCKNQVSIED